MRPYYIVSFVSMHPHKREGMLEWLDLLGKWSLMDVYVLIIIMVAFAVDIQSPEGSSLLGPNFYGVAVSVNHMGACMHFVLVLSYRLFLTRLFCISMKSRSHTTRRPRMQDLRKSSRRLAVSSGKGRCSQ